MRRGTIQGDEAQPREAQKLYDSLRGAPDVQHILSCCCWAAEPGGKVGGRDYGSWRLSRDEKLFLLIVFFEGKDLDGEVGGLLFALTWELLVIDTNSCSKGCGTKEVHFLELLSCPEKKHVKAN